jgi:hypothetical protein
VLLAAFVMAAVPSEAAAPRLEPFRWYRSAVVHHGHVVRIALLTGADDHIVRAEIRRGNRTVHVGLFDRVARHPGSATPAIGYLFCVEVRLHFRVGHRKVVDAITGRAPDLARPNSRDGRERDDTYPVNLAKGPCKRLRARYLPPER